MKSVKEINEIFNFNDQQKVIEDKLLYKIIAFRTWHKDQVTTVNHFRIYSKMWGSFFQDYNSNLQLHTDVFYYINIKNDEIYREVIKKLLAKNIISLDLKSIIDKI